MTQNNIPNPQNDSDAPTERDRKRTAPVGERLEFTSEAAFNRWRVCRKKLDADGVELPDDEPEVFLANCSRPLWSF